MCHRHRKTARCFFQPGKQPSRLRSDVSDPLDDSTDTRNVAEIFDQIAENRFAVFKKLPDILCQCIEKVSRYLFCHLFRPAVFFRSAFSPRG